MKIVEVSFKKIGKKMFLFVYYDSGKIRKFNVKDKYKTQLFYLLTDISILDKYR